MTRLASLALLLLTACPKEEENVEDSNNPPASEVICEEEVFEGTYEILTTDAHIKHSFTVTEEVDHVEMEMTWADPAWNFEVAIGLGTCPDHGTTLYTVSSDESPLTGTLNAYEIDGGMPTGAWFAHVALVGNAHEVGESMDYTLTVRLCPAE